MSLHVPEEAHRHPHELLGDAILGLNDGLMTTLVWLYLEVLYLLARLRR